MAAGRVLGGGGGLGLLLSGLPAMSIAFGVLYAIAWVISSALYDVVDCTLNRIAASFRRIYHLFKNAPPPVSEDQIPLIDLEEVEDREASPVALKRASPKVPNLRSATAVCFTTLTAIIVVIVLQSVRPKSPPYAHMSGSLPITLIEAAWLQPINSEFCLPHPVEVAIFPFERFNKFYNQTTTTTTTSNWMPQSEMCSRANGPGPPPWLEHPGGDRHHKRAKFQAEYMEYASENRFQHGPSPHRPPTHGPPHRPSHHGPPPHGGHHDDHFPTGQTGLEHDTGPPEHRGHGHQGGYSPICDPLKLSNTNATVLPSLAEGIQSKKPAIKNILFLTLESTRKDVFPLKKDSHVYESILATYTSPNATAELDAKLANFTNTAAFLSGESTGFESVQDGISEQSWRAAFKNGMGGINVEGAITQAAYTLKSLLSSHCGVEPLPVDFTEETGGRIYQACIPQILEWLGASAHDPEPEQKRNQIVTEKEKENYRSLDWTSTFIQSVTDQFDNQDVLNEQMGFKHVVAESTLSNERSKHYPPKQPWVNYFGYAESETMGYLRDLFVDGQQQGKRVFASHLTSSPHHPFATPKDWVGKTTYMNQKHWHPNDPFEEYLNTIKYQDEWVSDIFQMLHDVGALHETLVVMTGDHGLAFKSLDKSQSAVNNGHISNFAIPLLFIHPDLPRIQISASTTPMSVIPTILDLLLETNSLSSESAKTASDLLPSFQGNSLIRDLDFSVQTTGEQIEEAFFQPWHFSAINPGGSLLAISDAGSTFRLVLPLCSAIPLRFTDIAVDPTETDPIVTWTMDELIAIIKVRHGVRAKDWVQLANELGRWWFWNQRAKWGYWGVARSTSRGGHEEAGKGQIKHKHWWETRSI